MYEAGPVRENCDPKPLFGIFYTTIHRCSNMSNRDNTFSCLCFGWRFIHCRKTYLLLEEKLMPSGNRRHWSARLPSLLSGRSYITSWLWWKDICRPQRLVSLTAPLPVTLCLSSQIATAAPERTSIIPWYAFFLRISRHQKIWVLADTRVWVVYRWWRSPLEKIDVSHTHPCWHGNHCCLAPT